MASVSYETPSLAEYITFQSAYDHFNSALWAGKLPQVLITLQRKKGARGYFSPSKFTGRGFDGKVDELAMNPDTFVGRSDEEILSTLVHEMAHVWEQHEGKPPRGGYHGRAWANEMKRIGLQPSTTAEPGGKETGQKVSHYILPDGLFIKEWAELAKTGLKLRWESQKTVTVKAAKKDSKIKFTCQLCGQNTWAKPGANVICGVCFEQGETEAMIAS